MEKPYPNPEAVKWATREQPLHVYLIKLVTPDNPIWRAMESLPKDFPKADIEALEMLALDQWPNINQQNLMRNLYICLDFDYLTNGKDYTKSKAYGELANKYDLTEDTIKRQVQIFLPS